MIKPMSLLLLCTISLFAACGGNRTRDGEAPPAQDHVGGAAGEKVAQKGQRQQGRVTEKVENRVDEETDQAVDSVLDKALGKIFN